MFSTPNKQRTVKIPNAPKKDHTATIVKKDSIRIIPFNLDSVK